jgi:YebC/PmpR family DNA-binding regulatory protein
MNFRLRLAIEAAREANMPNENVERAIKRGAGELDGQAIEELTYEGYGPNGIALIIRALTDNKNRTGSAIRTTLSRHDGNLGQAGSVLWMFALKGRLRFPREILTAESSDTLELAAIDAGADDVSETDHGILITCDPSQTSAIQKKLTDQGFPNPIAALELVATNEVPTDANTETKLENLIEDLDNLDDVDAVFTNAA